MILKRIKAGHIIKAETNQREDEKARGDSPVTYHVLLIDGEDGCITAEVPALPGCVSQGRTREEALSNIREAITAYLKPSPPIWRVYEPEEDPFPKMCPS
jgi:predicted RNase H-like HicB family nuclease